MLRGDDGGLAGWLGHPGRPPGAQTLLLGDGPGSRERVSEVPLVGGGGVHGVFGRRAPFVGH